MKRGCVVVIVGIVLAVAGGVILGVEAGLNPDIYNTDKLNTDELSGPKLVVAIGIAVLVIGVLTTLIGGIIACCETEDHVGLNEGCCSCCCAGGGGGGGRNREFDMELTDEERADEKTRNRDIEERLLEANAREEMVRKLLLLGAGESGKSTLFKQMITIYGKGFGEEDRREYHAVIQKNLMGSIITLCQQSEALEDELEVKLSEEAQESRQFILERHEDDPISEEMAQHIATLWADGGIQNTFDLRNRYQLIDSAPYFLDKLQQIKDPDYLPSEQDVLRARVRTTGIVEMSFNVDGNEFKMFDVGGQRNERKKWIHCFDAVTAVLFVASLSCYDLTLYEDRSQNRMVEALMLFQEVCNARWFKDTSIILLLNKKDLFANKIKKVPLTKCFPDFDGGSDFDAACEYIQDQFEGRVSDGMKQIYTHITCATDTNNMRVVFNAVKDIVIRKNLQQGGLLS